MHKHMYIYSILYCCCCWFLPFSMRILSFRSWLTYVEYKSAFIIYIYYLFAASFSPASLFSWGFFSACHENAFAFDLRFVISAAVNGLPEDRNGIPLENVWECKGNDRRSWTKGKQNVFLFIAMHINIFIYIHICVCAPVCVSRKRSKNCFHQIVERVRWKLFEQGSYLLEK